MQRPVRILVFGILCVLMGVLSGFDNLNGLLMAAIGPGIVQVQELGQGQFAEMIEATSLAMKSALGQPTYRIVLGVESLLGGLMAGALIVAGVGLLQDRLWALRLTKWWGYFALVSAVVTVVLQVRFVMPQNTAMPPGTEAAGLMCMLPFLWLFPVLLLTLLGRPVVRDYLAWRENQRRAGLVGGVAYAQQSPAGPTGQSSPAQAADQPNPTRRPGSAGSAQDTWRDDPWNDASSQ